jgi:hydroxyacylglutathione hydrolase
VLTGDTLFVGDIARPDLAVERREGARGIFRSLNDKLLSLPAHTEVWPGHLGGSLCGGPGMDMKVSSTIGYERAHNSLLSVSDEEEFVRRTTAALAPQPPNFHRIVEINRGPLARESIEAHPLTPRQVDQQRTAGALLADVRTAMQFDEAHIPGSVCTTILQAGFGSKLAWLAGSDAEIVLIGRDDADARRATELAAAVGITSIAGHLAGGMTTWREEQRPTQSIERMTVTDLHERWEGGAGVQVLDVRERSEWERGHVPDSLFVPYHGITELPAGADPARPLAVICSSGQRSAVGASLVQRHGAVDVIHVVDGGVPEWERNGWPIESPDPGV